MKKLIQRMFALSAVAGVASLMIGATAPAEAARSAEAETFGHDDVEQLSCNQDQARQTCCPIYCSLKPKEGWKAAEEKATMCLKGYGCEKDVNMGQCESWFCNK